MKCIYIDVLIVLNIYVNYFLLRATSKFTHSPLKVIRCIIASFLGSLFSLTILIPNGGFLLSFIIKIFAAIFIIFVAFGFKDKKKLLKLTAYFYIINFIFGGIVMVMYITFKPSFMAFNNSYFYVDFSLVSLIIFTILAYFAVSLLRYFLDKGAAQPGRYKIIIKKDDLIYSMDAISDTGNSLIDGFTGKPVIICCKTALKQFGDDITSKSHNLEYSINNNFRLIPYSTIGDTGLIPVFKPDEVIIKNEESKKIFKVDALIGVNLKDTPAIFNPCLLV